MRPDELLRALRRGDIDEVDSRDALALYDVFEGYALANETLRTALNALSERFHGPPSASGFTKAYLLSAECRFAGTWGHLIVIFAGSWGHPFRSIMGPPAREA